MKSYELRQLGAADNRNVSQREGTTEALRAACLTLARTSPGIIRSMHVTVPLVTYPHPTGALVELAECIAAEYGLIATTERRDQYLEVHFSRRNRQADENYY